MVFLFVLLIILIIFTFSKISIEIDNFKFDSKRKEHINRDFSIILKLQVLGEIPLISIVITREKLKKWNLKQRIKKMDWKFIKDTNKMDKEVIEAAKHLNLISKSLELELEFGTENAALTAILVPILSTGISFFVKKREEKRTENLEFYFKIQPIFQNQNFINLAFSGIFQIKMVHIINTIWILNKKRRVEKHERTSNRRSYDYGYE